MALRRWLLGIAPPVLFGILAFSGYNPAPSGRIDQQTQQAKLSVVGKSLRKEIGTASWYEPEFQGQETANGDIFDQKQMTAAHPNLPMGSKAEVTNLENGKKVEVNINDRGPYAKNRVIDLSGGAANKLDIKKNGTALVKIVTEIAKN